MSPASDHTFLECQLRRVRLTISHSQLLKDRTFRQDTLSNTFSATERSIFRSNWSERNTAMPPFNTSAQQATAPNSNAPQTFDKVPDVDPKTGLHEKSSSTALKNRSDLDLTVSHGILRQSSSSDPNGPLEVGTQKCNLPPEKVFSIQLGSELFRLSGASIASDGQL